MYMFEIIPSIFQVVFFFEQDSHGFFFLNASGGFCLHGYVAALSCLLHHMVGRIGGDTTKSGVELVEGVAGGKPSLEDGTRT